MQITGNRFGGGCGGNTLVHTQIPIVDVLRLVVTQVIDYAGGRWKPWKPFEAQESIARQYETGITRFESWPPNFVKLACQA